MTTAQVFWDKLLLTLAAAWLVAMPIGRWISGYHNAAGDFAGPKKTGWRSPAAVLLYVIGACIAGAAVAALIVFFLSEPEDSLFDVAWGVANEAWRPFALTATAVAVPVTLIIMIVRRWRFRRRLLRRGFAVIAAEGAREFATPPSPD